MKELSSENIGAGNAKEGTIKPLGPMVSVFSYDVLAWILVEAIHWTNAYALQILREEYFVVQCLVDVACHCVFTMIVYKYIARNPPTTFLLFARMIFEAWFSYFIGYGRLSPPESFTLRSAFGTLVYIFGEMHGIMLAKYFMDVKTRIEGMWFSLYHAVYIIAATIFLVTKSPLCFHGSHLMNMILIFLLLLSQSKQNMVKHD